MKYQYPTHDNNLAILMEQLILPANLLDSEETVIAIQTGAIGYEDLTWNDERWRQSCVVFARPETETMLRRRIGNAAVTVSRHCDLFLKLLDNAPPSCALDTFQEFALLHEYDLDLEKRADKIWSSTNRLWRLVKSSVVRYPAVE